MSDTNEEYGQTSMGEKGHCSHKPWGLYMLPCEFIYLSIQYLLGVRLWEYSTDCDHKEFAIEWRSEEKQCKWVVVMHEIKTILEKCIASMS